MVGPICETGDFFARGRELPLPEPGDLLAIGYTGAYGRVMGSAYNARPLCAEVLVEGGDWRVIREAGTYEDLVRGETPLEQDRAQSIARSTPNSSISLPSAPGVSSRGPRR